MVDGISTEWDINKGVPQRTVLGPVLFTIMVNDISPVNMTTLCLMKTFADDITLIGHFRITTFGLFFKVSPGAHLFI